MPEPKKDFSSGVYTGLPIFLSYIPIAITFGLLARNAGFDITQTVSFSAFVYAGASQFVALNLFTLGAGLWEIVFTTFLVNLRHLLMSASLFTKIKNPRLTPILGFGVTDESFAVASMKEGHITVPFLLGLQLPGYLGLLGGTSLGYMAGNFLPGVIRDAMGFALYALFIALITPPASRSKHILFIFLTAGTINWGLSLLGLEQAGIRIVVAIIGGALTGTIFDPEGRGLK